METPKTLLSLLNGTNGQPFLSPKPPFSLLILLLKQPLELPDDLADKNKQKMAKQKTELSF